MLVKFTGTNDKAICIDASSIYKLCIMTDSGYTKIVCHFGSEVVKDPIDKCCEAINIAKSVSGNLTESHITNVNRQVDSMGLGGMFPMLMLGAMS